MEVIELKKGILKSIEDYLTDNDWHFLHEENKDLFTMGMNINNKLKSIDYYILVKHTGFLTIATIDIKADEECRQNVIEYITRANYGLTDGCFELDSEKGYIRYRVYSNCMDSIPSPETVERALLICAEMFERYGNGILSVMFGMQTPKAAIEAAENR